MDSHPVKLARRTEWVLVVLALVLIVAAYFKADDNLVSAGVFGALALAIAVLLTLITDYLGKRS